MVETINGATAFLEAPVLEGPASPYSCPPGERCGHTGPGVGSVISANEEGEGGNFDCSRQACWNDPRIGDLPGDLGARDGEPPLAAAISRWRFGNFPPPLGDADLGAWDS